MPAGHFLSPTYAGAIRGFRFAFAILHDYEYWLRLATHGAKFLYLPEKLAGSRNHGATKTQRFRRQAHVEINDVLKRVLGVVPEKAQKA